jgi:phosphoglycerate-specific signal transduction histidine kinase
MPIKTHKCPECGFVETAMRKPTSVPPRCEKCYYEREIDVRMNRVFKAPEAKFMEKTDSFRNKSKRIGQDKELLERARVHSRDHALDELIQTNEAEIVKKNKWLVENSDGSLRKRKKIDDI